MINSVGSDHVVSWAPSDYDSSFNENIWELKTGFTSRVEMLLPVLLEGVHEGKLTPREAGRGRLREPGEDLRPLPAEGHRSRSAPTPTSSSSTSTAGQGQQRQVLTRSGWTVLDGHEMHGWGVATFLRGKQMSRWQDGAPKPEFIGDADGRYLRPGVPVAAAVPVGDRRVGVG